MFSYESYFNKKENSWSLAVDIPLKGEELLIIKYIKKKYVFSGNFYKRIARSLREKELLKLKFFFSRIFIMAKISESRKINYNKNVLIFESKSKSIKKTRFVFPNSSLGKLMLEVSKEDDASFDRLDFRYSSINNDNVLKMFLFLDSCEK